MVPGFVDTTIKRLLHGCLNSDPKSRLTAMDCRQLLAFSEDLSEEQRTTVQEAIGCEWVCCCCGNSSGFHGSMSRCVVAVEILVDKISGIGSCRA